jgi:hypothetical protein
VKKWLAIGGGLLLVAWAPFIYAELTSEPAEKKARELPSDAADDELVAEGEGEQGGHVVSGKGAAAPVEAPQAEAPAPEEPAAEPGAQPGAVQPEATAKLAAPEEPGAPSGEHDEPAEGEEAEEEEAPPPAASGPTAQLKKAYETEPRDALWATDTERRIGVVFGSDDVPEGMLQRATCRRAVCSLEVRWTRDHATQYVGAFQALSDQFGGEIGVEPVGEPDDEGHQIVHLYVLRKGYTAADVAK